MALRATAEAAAALPRGLRRLFSTSFFVPPPTKTEPPPKAEPNTNLFVSGLSKRTTTDGLREAFEKFGEVVHARVITDRVSGFSKGFGFVKYATIEDASEGIKGMDGKYLDGWVIFAEYARPRPPPPPLENYGSPSYSRPAQYGDASYSGYNSGINTGYNAPQNADPSQFAYNSQYTNGTYGGPSYAGPAQPFDNTNSSSGSSTYNGSGSQQYSSPSPIGSAQYNGPLPNGSSNPQSGYQSPIGSPQQDNLQYSMPLTGGSAQYGDSQNMGAPYSTGFPQYGDSQNTSAPYSTGSPQYGGSQNTGAPYSTGSPQYGGSQNTGAPYSTGSPQNGNMGVPYAGYSQAGSDNQYGYSEGILNGSHHHGGGQDASQYDSATFSEPLQRANSG